MFAAFMSGRRSSRAASSKAVLAMAALAGIAATAGAARADTTIFDGTFADTNWFEDTLAGGDAWVHTVGQQTTGGNPDAYRGQHWNLKDEASAAFRLTTFNGFSGATYNPATSGPLAFASYKYDAFVAFDDGRAGGPGGAVVLVNAALKQGDSVYEAGAVTFSEPTWVTYQHPSTYSAAAFHKVSGTGPANPVFSSSGSPLTFGYINSLAAPYPYSIAHGVDNFTVNLTSPVTTTGGNFAVNVDLGTRSSYAGGSGSVLGTPGNTWNVLGGGTAATSGLKNSEGAQTSVGFHWTPYTNFDTLGPVSAVGDNLDESARPELMSDGAINGIGGDPTPKAYGGEVALDGLVPNSKHDVVLYGALYGFADGGRTHTTTFTVNGKQLSTTSLYDGDGLNYVTFNNVPADANGEIFVRLQNHSANVDGSGNGGFFVLNGFELHSLGITIAMYTANVGGDFATGSNWGGTAPSGAGAIAELKGSDGASITLNLSAPRTLGTLGFGGTRNYKITGSALTLDGGNGYHGVVNVSGGSHEIAAPLTFGSSGGEIILAQNSRLKLSGAVSGIIGRLAIGTGATLDLSNSTPLVVDYNRFSNLAAVDALVTSGRAAGGTGITSSLVQSNARYATVVVESSAILGAAGGTFRGQAVDGSSLLLGVFLKGDGNLSGKVDFADLVTLAQNYNKTTGSTWVTGDSNFDGAVNFSDLVSLAQNYNQSFALSANQLAANGFSASFQAEWAMAQSFVPEPASLSMLAGASIVGLRRRRTR